MKISIRTENNVAVIDLEGDLMPGYDSEDLGDKVAELLKDGCRNFLLNFSKIDLIDSIHVVTEDRSPVAYPGWCPDCVDWPRECVGSSFYVFHQMKIGIVDVDPAKVPVPVN